VTANSQRYSELRRVARRRGQRGYFTTAQAEAAGIARMELTRLVRRGLVERAAAGVYRFRIAAVANWRDRLAAEILSTGGVACGLSAAALYELADPPVLPSVLVPRGLRTTKSGHHSTRDLPRYECATADGLRTLTPIRAVLDSVHCLPAVDAVGMVERAIVRGLVKPEALRRRANELVHAKRPGCVVLLRILGDLHPELARSRNEWEALVVRRAKQFGLAPPRLEYELCIDGRRYIADAAWPEQRVALEFDGRDPHMRRRVHDYDTGRRNDFTDAGWFRFGITASALRLHEDRTFRQVARAIARR
jgi:very-short-patch-repair endonuclease